MKNPTINSFLVFCIFTFSVSFLHSQSDLCRISDNPTDPNPDNYKGGWFKPAQSNIGGAPSDGYFPVLIVFVQFKNEPGDSTTNNFESWPARRPPNYFDSLIATSIGPANLDWWDKYNGFAISDYWHEFSRGKLHIYGNKLSITLPEEIGWYEIAGRGINKVNKDIYETIKPLIQNWTDYDRWKYIDNGEFKYESDGLIDMMYIVYRSRRNFIFDNLAFVGVANLGNCEGAPNFKYTIDSNSASVTQIFSAGIADPLGSGVRVFADSTSPYSRQQFLDKVTHEHGHYLFHFNHKPYAKMEGFSGAHDFSLSPWEVVKLGYINQKFVDYTNPVNYLFDYSSRGLSGVDTNEILQVPISSDGSQFFLIANRRKVSQWDRRIGGDTLAIDKWQYLKNVNPEYGKGVYIYHIKRGYLFLGGGTSSNGDIDLECADGLWSWEAAGFNRPALAPDTVLPVICKTYPSYNNDYPDGINPGYESGRDEMSRGIIFTPGSPDNFLSNPIDRGAHTLYSNEDDYVYTLAKSGDRWDGWNVGYNEIFSPYSSPNTNDMNNNGTGIFIWYRDLDEFNNKATLEIYRSGHGGKSEDEILEITPPSRPMGLRVLECDSLPVIRGYKRIKLSWFHNMEPDMEKILQGNQKYIKIYRIYRSTAANMTVVPPDAIQFSERYYQEIATVQIYITSTPEYTDTVKSVCNFSPVPGEPWHEYPVRYRIQAIDKYDSVSVLSDLAKTSAWIIKSTGSAARDNIPELEKENIPKLYSLKQNYPNPFNPSTNIQYDLPFDNFVTIKIFDILGREVVTLVKEYKNAGSYIVSFNASNLSSGIYYYKIEAVGFEQVRRMILIK